VPYYRDLAFMVAMGMTPEELFLGLFAKEGDPGSGGRQMPNHWSLPRRRVFSHSSVIGTQFPHAAGIAHELRRSGRPGVVLVTGGEGATSQGDLHEALNFTSLRRLPVIFLIQNNQYSISVPVRQQVAGDLAERARGYDMAGTAIDGNDILAVYREVKWAVERARAGEGPAFIEALTYRYYAHTSDDDDHLYRTAEEVAEWRRHDPISLLRAYLVEHRLLTEAEEEAVEEEADAPQGRRPGALGGRRGRSAGALDPHAQPRGDVHDGPRPQSPAGPDHGVPQIRVEAPHEQDLRLAATLPAAEEAGGEDAASVRDQKVAGTKELRKLGKGAVVEGPGVTFHDEQP